MKRYFLVDYERIENRNICLDGIEMLTESDTVYVLFSGDDTGVSFSMMEKINASKANIFQKHVRSDAEDALQYVIGFYMGKFSDSSVAVITDETFGYLPSLEKINLYVSNTIARAAAIMPVEQAQETVNTDWEIKFSNIMNGMDIGKSIEQELHKTLQKARETADSLTRANYTQSRVKDLFGTFPQDIAESIYDAIKPLIDPDDENKNNKNNK